MNKEPHAAHVIEVIANYFLAQRVKAGDDADVYKSSLDDHQAVIVAAVMTKQRADQESVDALFTAIDGLAAHYHTHGWTSSFGGNGGSCRRGRTVTAMTSKAALCGFKPDPLPDARRSSTAPENIQAGT